MELMRRRRGIMGLNGGAGIPVITATATGNPLTFETDLARPLKSLVIPFTPIQAAGTPSPDNPLPISGWIGATTTHTSENLLVVDGGFPGKIISAGGTLGNNSAFWTSEYFSISPGDYIITSEVNADIVLGLYTAIDYRTIKRTCLGEQQLPYHFTVEEPYRYCRMSVEKYKTADYPGGVLSKEVNVLPITFTDPTTGDPLTVYGGTFTLNEDGSVDLVATHVSHTITGGFSSGGSASGSYEEEAVYQAWNYVNNGALAGWERPKTTSVSITAWHDLKLSNFPGSGISVSGIGRITFTRDANPYVRIYLKESLLADISSAEKIKASINAWCTNNPIQVSYKLDTAKTYHFDNVGQLIAFLGTNNIWTDTNGTNTAIYLKHQS